MKVTLDDLQVPSADYSFPTASQVTFNEPPPDGAVIRIYRETPTQRLVNFQGQSILNPSNFELDSTQLTHNIEETLDKYNLFADGVAIDLAEGLAEITAGIANAKQEIEDEWLVLEGEVLI